MPGRHQERPIQMSRDIIVEELRRSEDKFDKWMEDRLKENKNKEKAQCYLR